MAFSFAVYTSDPNLLECELRRLEGHVNLPDGERLNAAGVGSYAQNQVLLHHFPRGEVPRSLRQIVPEYRSQALVYQAEALRAAASLEDNVQPLRFRRWLFCQSGALRGHSEIHSLLRAELPSFMQNHLPGDSAAAGSFALFLQLLRELGPLDSSSLDPMAVAQRLLRTGQKLQVLSRQAGVAYTSDFSLLACNEELLVGATFGGQRLSYTLLEGSEIYRACGLPPTYKVAERKLRAHMKRRTVAMASEVSPTATGWMEVPSGTALAVDSRIDVRRVTG